MTRPSAKERRRVTGRSLLTSHPVPRLAGVPTNLLGAAATTATAVAGWYIDRHAAA